MGLPRVLDRRVATGHRGPQGLPGVGSAAWEANHLYTEGSIIQAPDGSWLTALAEHTSGATFDGDLGNWTTVEVSAGSIANDALRASFADKSAQDTIEAGRLHDDVLTSRFRDEKLRIGASRFEITSASLPTKTFIGGFWPSWSLDKTTEEHVTTDEFNIPKEWAAFDVYVKGANSHATNLGNVRLRVTWAQKGEGDDISTTTQQANATLSVAGLSVRQSRKVLSTNVPLDTTKAHIIRVTRVAGDALDDLDNDWRFTGIELRPTAFVHFEPEVPEPPEDLTGRTFTQAMNAALGGLLVWHQNPPPVDDADDEGYKYFPATATTTTQDFTTSLWSGDKGPFVWDNRRNYDGAWNTKPNQLMAPNVYIGTRLCRAVFTTKALAMAATRAQVRRLVGMDAAAIEAVWTAAGGSAGDLITEAAYRASPETYCTTEFTHADVVYMVMVDKVVLPTPTMLGGADPSTNKVVVLDYEPGDTRTAAETTAHITAMAADVQGAGYEVMLYGNPLTAYNQQFDGIDDTNLRTLFDAVDYLEIKLWSKATEGSIPASWAAQVAKLGTLTTADWAKIVIGFELGTNPGTTLADAEWVRAKLTEPGSNHPTKVIFWRNHAQQGGSPDRLTNQKISMICFGTTTPPGL